MERALLSSLLSTRGNSMSTGVALCDAEGRIIFANTVFAREIGSSKGACVGMDIGHLLPHGDHAPSTGNGNGSNGHGNNGSGISWVRGNSRWTLLPDLDEHGDVTGFVITTSRDGEGPTSDTAVAHVVDITRHKKHEVKLQRAIYELEDEGSVMRTMMDNADAAMFMMDDQQRCIYLNAAAERLTGFTAAEVQGDALHNFIHHTRPDGSHYPLEDCPIDRALPQRARSKGEDVFVRKDGSFYPVAFVASPIIENGRAVGTVIEVQDITERKRSETEIQEANQRYDLVVKATNDAIWDWDSQTGTLWWSEGFTKLFGHERTGWNANLDDWFDWIHPDDRVRVKESFDRVMKGGGEFWGDEYRIRCADGGYRDVYARAHVLRSETSAPVRIVGAMQDITARKEAELRLKHSETELLQLANSINQLAWMARPDGHIFWYNERWYDYTGTTAADMEGWGWQSVHDPEVLPLVIERWKESIDRGLRFEGEFPLRGADGTYRWFLTIVEPLKDEEGKIVRWFGTNTDIHEPRMMRVDALFLAGLAERLAPLTGERNIITTALDELRSHLRVEAVFLAPEEEGMERWTAVDARGDEWRNVRPDPKALGISPQERGPIVIADVPTDTSPLSQWARSVDPGIASILAVPQPVKQAPASLFIAWRDKPGPWKEREIELVEEVLDRCWVGVDRARAEIAIKRSEEKYKAIFNSIDEGFCVIEVLYDGQGRANDWRFVETNPTFLEHTGLRDVNGKRMKELAPDIEDHWVERYAQVDLSRQAMRVLDHSPALDRWFDLYAFPIGDRKDHQIAVLFRDVSQEKRAEEQLRRTNALWETLYRSIQTCIYVKDAEGRILEANDATLAVLGKPEDVIGRSYEEYTRTEQEAAAMAANDRKVFECGGTLTFEEIVTVMGEPHTFYSTKTALHDGDGKVTGLVGISFDITERKRYEEMLLDMDLRKDQFLATLAHELRNPLAPIRNGLQILEYAADDPTLLEPRGR